MGNVSRPLYTSVASESLEDEVVMIGRVGVGCDVWLELVPVWSMFLFCGSGKEGTS